MPGSKGLLSGIISESGGLSGRSLKSGLETGAAAAKAAGCDGARGGVKACMQKVAPLAITSLTNRFSFTPLVDGVTIPADPSEMLRRGQVNPNVGFLAGAQTNDVRRSQPLTPPHLRSLTRLCLLRQSNRELFPTYMDEWGDLEVEDSIALMLSRIRKRFSLIHTISHVDRRILC